MQLGIFQKTKQTNRTMNTPTPRTDAESFLSRGMGIVPTLPKEAVRIDFAKTLERELTAVTEQRDGLHELHNKNAARSQELLELCGTLRKELTAMTEQRDEWKQKFIQQNKDLGCEQMDPDGTIWDYAKKVQTDLSAMTEQRDRMAEILRDILAYDKGEKPHDYWALQDHAQANAMAFDAWQEILRKIEQALETKP